MTKTVTEVSEALRDLIGEGNGVEIDRIEYKVTDMRLKTQLTLELTVRSLPKESLIDKLQG